MRETQRNRRQAETDRNRRDDRDTERTTRDADNDRCRVSSEQSTERRREIRAHIDPEIRKGNHIRSYQGADMIYNLFAIALTALSLLAIPVMMDIDALDDIDDLDDDE